MLLKSFSHSPIYHSIDIFNFSLEIPFNGWRTGRTDFSWRPESIAFETKSDCFPILVNVCIEESLSIPSEAKRAILLPFYVVKDSKIGFSEGMSIDESNAIELDEGWYNLLYCGGWCGEGDINKDCSEWCKLIFFPLREFRKIGIIYVHEDYSKESLPLTIELVEDEPA